MADQAGSYVGGTTDSFNETVGGGTVPGDVQDVVAGLRNSLNGPSQNGAFTPLAEGVVIVTITNYFKMRGRDVDCVPLTYRTWVVSGAADPTGASYLGARCGVTPFVDVVIVESWQV